MNKSILSLTIAAALGLTSNTAQAITITWGDNISPLATFPGPHAAAFSDPNLNNGFSQYNEFRMIVLDGSGAPTLGGEKSLVGSLEPSGAGKATTLPHDFVTWNFDNGNLTSVSNTDITPGAQYYAAGCGYITGLCTNDSAAPDGDVGLFKNTNALGSPFGFLAPTVGSAAAATYGIGSIIFDSTDDFSIFFPVLELQWAEAYFTPGSASDPVLGTGINFECSGALSGDVVCVASHQMQASEDSLCCAGLIMQWELHGTLDTPQVPIPAATWLFGSGLLSLIGVARRKRLS